MEGGCFAGGVLLGQRTISVPGPVDAGTEAKRRSKIEPNDFVAFSLCGRADAGGTGVVCTV